MKKFILMCLFIFFIITCVLFIYKITKNKTTENDLNIANLNGNVKSVTVFSFDVKEKFGELIDTNTSKLSFSSYNKNGNLIEESAYNNFKYTKKFIYDDDGNLTELSKYNSVGKLDFLTKYKYDDEGNLIESIRYDKNGKLMLLFTYKYDENGNLIALNSYNDKNKELFDELIKYKYDDEGNLIEYKVYSSPEEDFSSINTYKYDDNKNMIEHKYGQSSSKYKYDDKKNMIEVIYFNDYMPGRFETSISYLLFDDNNNWIRSYRVENDTKKYYKREIEYY